MSPRFTVLDPAALMGQRYVVYDPDTGKPVPTIGPREVPWQEELMTRVKDYLGIKPRKSTIVDIAAVEEGISTYDVRQKYFGTGAQEEFRRIMGRFFSGVSFGLTDIMAPEQAQKPETAVGSFLGAGAELAGFLAGPLKVSKAITGARLMPTMTGLRGIAQVLAEGSATLGIASGLSSIIPAFMENDSFTAMGKEIMDSTLMGALVGAIYPLSGVVPTRPLRIAVTVAVMDLIRSGKGEWFTIDDVIKGLADGSIDKEYLADRTFGYLMDIYFASKVPSMKKQLARLEKNAMVKEMMAVISEQAEQTILEIGERGLAPGARPTVQEATELPRAERKAVRSPRAKGIKSDVLSFIIKQGGVRPDEGGEYKRFTPRESGYPRLINRRGLEADRMREAMEEDGLLPEGSTESDFWAVMDTELKRAKDMRRVAEQPGYEEGEFRFGTETIETPEGARTYTVDELVRGVEDAVARDKPIPEAAKKSAEVQQDVSIAGAADTQRRTKEFLGEREEADLGLPKENLDFMKKVLHDLGIKDKDPDGRTLTNKDFRDAYKFLQMPFDIAISHPEFMPFYEAQMARDAFKTRLDMGFAEATKPYFELSTKERNLIDKALVERNLNEKEFSIEELKARGLNDKQIKGYQAIIDNLKDVGNFLIEEMRAHEVPEEVVKQFEKQAKFYLPHRWYGNWVVFVKDAKGKTLDMWGVNYFERYRARDAMREAYPGLEVTVMQRHEIPYEAYQTAPVYAVRKMVDLALERAKVGETEQVAIKEALGDLYKAKGFGMHFVRKKNVPGWTEDLHRPLAEYFSGFTGYVSKMRAIKAFSEAFDGIPKHKPKLLKYTIDYVKYVTGDAMEFKTAKNLAYFWYLFGNVKSTAMQLTQNFVLGWPVLSKQTKWALPKMMEAMKDRATGNISKAERDFIAALEKQGVVEPQMTQEISGWVGHPIFKMTSGKVGKAIQIADIFRHGERFNREAMAVALYRAGITDVAKAAKLIYEAHFYYGKGNRPVLMRGYVSPVMVFRSWYVNYLTFLKNSIKEGRTDVAAKSLFALVTFAGLSGLPFWELIRNAWIKLFGEDPEILAWEYLGKEVGSVLIKGIPTMAGIDFSGSVGMGDIIPTNLKELGGVFADIPTRAKKISKSVHAGDYVRALEDAAPEALRNPFAAFRLYTAGATSRSGRPVLDITTGRPMTMKKAEAIAKVFGFYPERFSEQYTVQESLDKFINMRMQRKQSWADRYNIAKINRDANEMREVLAEIREYNEKMRTKGRPEDQITDREFSAMLRTRIRPINIPPKYMMPRLKKYQEFLD